MNIILAIMWFSAAACAMYGRANLDKFGEPSQRRAIFLSIYVIVTFALGVMHVAWAVR